MALIDPFDDPNFTVNSQPQGQLIDPFDDPSFSLSKTPEATTNTAEVTKETATQPTEAGGMLGALGLDAKRVNEVGSSSLGGLNDQLVQEERQASAAAVGAKAPQSPTPFGTQVLSEFADQPQAKIVAFAKNRFPDMPIEEAVKRYGIVNNSIVFVDKDGHLYKEDEPGLAASIAGEALPIAGGVIGGVAGAAGGLGGALAGAGLGTSAGKLAKAGVANVVLGEDKDAAQLVGDASTGFLEGVAGEGAGRIIGKVGEKIINKRLNPENLIDDSEAIARQQSADALEIGKLSRAEATGDKEEILRERTLRGLEGSSPVYQASDEARAGSVTKAINEKLLDKIAPADYVSNAASAAREAAKKSISAAKKARADEAGPLYNSAYDEIVPEDAPILKNQYIQNKIASLKNDPLYAEELATTKPNSVGLLNLVKQSLGDEIETATGFQKKVLTGLQKRLVGTMDEVSPDYKAARATFADESSNVNPLEEGLIGKIANTKDTQLKTVARSLFDPAESDPRVLEKAIDEIHAQDPNALNAIVRNHLQAQFEGMRSSVMDNGTILGRAFAEKVMGTPKKRDILFTALKYNPEAKQNLAHMARVFPALAKGAAEGSPTATRQEIIKGMKGKNVYSGLRALSEPVNSLRNMLTNLETEKAKVAYKAMAEASLNPKYADEMAKIRKLSPQSKEGLTRLGALVSRIAQDMGEDSLEFNAPVEPQVKPIKQ